MVNSLQAKVIVFLSALLLLVIYLIEYKGLLDNNVGPLKQLTGQIKACPGIEDIDKKITLKKKKISLHIGSAEKIGPFRYTRPRSAKKEVARLCREKARVAITYRTWKPQLRKDMRYTMVALKDLKNEKDIYTSEEYHAWNKTNRLWGYGVAGFLAFSLLYGLAILIVPQWTVRDHKRMHYDGYQRGVFLIKSNQRRGEAWVYLALFIGLASYFGGSYPREKNILILLMSIICGIAAYAYLVETCNTNQLTLTDNMLAYKQGPLPWFGRKMTFPLNRIYALYGDQETHTSRHGPYTLYPLVLETVDGEVHRLFFTNSYEEAQAIAELVVGKFDNKDVYLPPSHE